MVSKIGHGTNDEDVRSHFLKNFGPIAAMQPHQEPGKGGKGGKGSSHRGDDRSLLIQFYSRDAREGAVKSPLPVANNRFIHVKRVNYNLTDPATLPSPPPWYPEGDGGAEGQQQHQSGKGGKGGKGKGSKGGADWYGGKGGKGDASEGGYGRGSGRSAGGDGSSSGGADGAAAEAMSDEPEVSGADQLRERQDKAKELKRKEDEILERRRATLQKQLDESEAMADKLRKLGKSGASMLPIVDKKIADLRALLQPGKILEASTAAAEAAAAEALGAGGGGSAKKAKMSMTLDLRPTTLRVEPIPDTCDRDTLSAFFEGYGELDSVQMMAPSQDEASPSDDSVSVA